VVDSRRDFVYVDDLVEMAVLAAGRGQGVYHVSSGNDYSISEIYQAVAQAMECDTPEPELVSRGADDVASLLIEPDRSLGWQASTPLASGIARAVAWYQANGVTNTYTHLAMKG
jgi:UDP-glucose 4-epimerase